MFIPDQTQPRPVPRPAEARLGLGPVLDRKFDGPRYYARWSEVLGIHLNVAALAGENNASRVIHQPFRVDAISVQHTASNLQDLFITIAATNIDTSAMSITDRDARNLWNQNYEGVGAQYIHTGGQQGSWPSGQIITDVPTRIIMRVTNATGAALHVQAFLSLTYLGTFDARSGEEHKPSGCDDCGLR